MQLKGGDNRIKTQYDGSTEHPKPIGVKLPANKSKDDAKKKLDGEDVPPDGPKPSKEPKKHKDGKDKKKPKKK